MDTDPLHTEDAIPFVETILLVEDNDAVRNIVKIVLDRCGYKVLSASSGKEALQVIDIYPDPIHLLVSDVDMPDLTGPEVANLILQARPTIRVMFMSGYISDERTYGVLADSSVSFLQKPFTSEELAKKVRVVLSS